MEPRNEDINAKKIISVEDANYEVTKSKAGGFQACQDSNPDLCARVGGVGGGRVLLGILGGGVPPGSQNPDPISEQKMSFSRPVFRPGLSAEIMLV